MKTKKRSNRGSHMKITKEPKTKNRRVKQRIMKKKSKELFGPKRRKIQYKNIIKLLLVILFIAVLYITFSTKEDFKNITDSLDKITNTLETINNKQTDLETKQIELEEKQKALETSKAEKKAEEERLAKEKAEAEEKAKQEEAIRLAKLSQTQVTSRGGSVVRSSSNVTYTLNEYQSYAKDLCINTYGWTENDFQCLVKLWNRESGWNPNAHNKSSGAHGIPQSLPASKMASEGADYYTNGKTQIRWGLKYIKNRYGTPAKAWAHSQSKGWY